MYKALVTFLMNLFFGILWCFLLHIVACQSSPPPPPSPEVQSPKSTSNQKVKSSPPVTCPVCGLQFDPKESAKTALYQGKTYYFFLKDHQKAFTLNPMNYLKQNTDKRATPKRTTGKK